MTKGKQPTTTIQHVTVTTCVIVDNLRRASARPQRGVTPCSVTLQVL